MHRSQGRDHLALIDEFIGQGLVGEVLGLIKVGKEASVYCCRAGPAIEAGLVAVKVYRGRAFGFKNDAVYQEARAREMGISGSALRAFNKRKTSAIGRQVHSSTWVHHEYEVLQRLHGALTDVPRPIAQGESMVLMEYLGDEEVAAQQLNRVRLSAEEAGPLFQRLMNNVELFLALNVVHGDLSPHNVLYWQGDVRVIDFPQATDPRFNRHAQDLLARDIANLCSYFAAYGVEASPDELAHDLWQRFLRAEL